MYDTRDKFYIAFCSLVLVGIIVILVLVNQKAEDNCNEKGGNVVSLFEYYDYKTNQAVYSYHCMVNGQEIDSW